MLDEGYTRLLASLIASLRCQIVLPPGQERYFEESGPIATYQNEMRSAVRTRVRARGILVPETQLPVIPRTIEPSVIFTKDFSKTGFGFVADRQYFPGEVVRVLLATFWMRVKIRRCGRTGPNCYENGGTLISNSEPSMDAFETISDQVSSLLCFDV
ncbi:MAG: hypothetical protein MI861_03100 [Pirellulales bacterium]|nr:hypothetical protein [Pirellulales bacterium]